MFQFRLRQLFGFVALVSCLLTAFVLFGGITALVLLLGTLIVVAHLSATALGSRLRAHADSARACQAIEQNANESRFAVMERWARLANVQFGRRSPWHGRGGTALPWVPRFVVAAVTLGGAAGALLLTETIGHRTSMTGVVVGAISFAVLSGWFAFLGSSFYGIVRHGLRDAASEQDRDDTGPSIRR